MQNKTYGQGSDPCHGPERTRRMKNKNELLGLTGGLGNLYEGVTSWYKGRELRCQHGGGTSIGSCYDLWK